MPYRIEWKPRDKLIPWLIDLAQPGHEAMEIGKAARFLAALSPRDADLNPARRHLGVFSLAVGYSRTSCLCAPLRMASLMAVLRREWMPLPRLPSRLAI
jgi:hypothetical protein